ncbi:S8 family peptidase [Alienimonas sp. DA493]|uniref:S8 family peptidase n=1 Tax=Alienimonas sp. DA493 TaxID=3373605 RepID=UPI0037549525
MPRGGDYEHIRLPTPPVSSGYAYAGRVGGPDREPPPRPNRAAHGAAVGRQLEAATDAALAAAGRDRRDAVRDGHGVVLTLEAPEQFELPVAAFDRPASGVDLIDAEPHGRPTARRVVVYLALAEVDRFADRFRAYAESDLGTDPPGAAAITAFVESIRAATFEELWRDDEPIFPDDDTAHFWEVWLRSGSDPAAVAEEFRAKAAGSNLAVPVGRFLVFPERVVLKVRGRRADLAGVPGLFDTLVQLRRARRLVVETLDYPPDRQRQLVEALARRVGFPPPTAPAACLIDTGTSPAHPLLGPAYAEGGVLTTIRRGGVVDSHGHGTGLAGVALYADALHEKLEGTIPVPLDHGLESVRFTTGSPSEEPDLDGLRTLNAVSAVEISHPDRPRVFCLASTQDGNTDGGPSSWSAAIDRSAAGVRFAPDATAGAPDDPKRLFVVAAGNVRGRENVAGYPDRNHVSAAESPAQAWNALTVGAYTEREGVPSDLADSVIPLAPRGGLSPASRTTLAWPGNRWPVKPDVVLEGGNCGQTGGGGLLGTAVTVHEVPDLQLLTTAQTSTGGLFGLTGDTSEAAAQATSYAAIVAARNPDFWPETVRGLFTRCAEWTDQMLREFPDARRSRRLKVYGHGRANLDAMLRQSNDSATMIRQETIRPFRRSEGDAVVSHEYHLHRLPWPGEELRRLGDAPVRMRVALSYFVEPSPGGAGWSRPSRYRSHGLKFRVPRPDETAADFARRCSWEGVEEDDRTRAGEDRRSWSVRRGLRERGSLHSDTWHGTAEELADAGRVAVVPAGGWWKERPHHARYDSDARYALLVTIETAEPTRSVVLRTPIVNALPAGPATVTVES